MYLLYLITGSLLLISLIKNTHKTVYALKIALQRFLKIVPAFIIMISISSILLYFLPDHLITLLLDNDNKAISLSFATSLGSLLLLPGFITFPLCGLLLKKGVSYMVISAFTTTLMMVGILTFPIEQNYFGTKATLLRNVLSLVIALIVAFFTGLFYNELF